jgi:hypothetical protein
MHRSVSADQVATTPRNKPLADAVCTRVRPGSLDDGRVVSESVGANVNDVDGVVVSDTAFGNISRV